MKFFKEATISGSRVLWSTPTTELINITLAKAPGLPPVQLVVTSNNVAFANVHGAVSQHSVVNSNFEAQGQYVLCKPTVNITEFKSSFKTLLL